MGKKSLKATSKQANVVSKEKIKEIFVHFKTDEHYITLNEFVKTVSSYETIADNFMENIFNVKNGVKIYILPPKPGTFLITIGVAVKAIAGSAILGAVVSEEFKGFIRGLTKKIPVIAKKFPDGYEMGKGGEILGEMLTGFVQSTSEEVQELERKLPKKINIDAATKAKAEFYSMCSKSKEIKGIGFDTRDEFPIKRCDFVTRAVPPAIKPLPEKQELKELIIVKSVNTDEKLQWDFKDLNTKESFSANIEDDDFNEKLLNGLCPLKKSSTNDVILALVEFRKKLENGKERKDSYTVKEVYKFNKKKLKDQPEGMKVNRPKTAKVDNGQLNFFGNQQEGNNAD